MSVRDNMAFGLKLRSMPREDIDRKVGEAADVLGIGDYLDRKPRPCPAASVSGWPWVGPSSATRRSSSSTNP